MSRRSICPICQNFARNSFAGILRHIGEVHSFSPDFYSELKYVNLHRLEGWSVSDVSTLENCIFVVCWLDDELSRFGVETTLVAPIQAFPRHYFLQP